MNRYCKEQAKNYAASLLLSAEERKKMQIILNGEDSIDSSKIIKHRTIKNNDMNFFIPEKWNY